jgi:hypothetical protein
LHGHQTREAEELIPELKEKRWLSRTARDLPKLKSI